MDATYPLYAGADPLFYDQPHQARPKAPDLFSPADSVSWKTWSSTADDIWSFWSPPQATLPEQGWKIHVSATGDTADITLETVSLYCHHNALPFKFLRDGRILQRTLGKDGDRRVAGKFITIYPTSPAELQAHLTELDASLAGMPAPYVLSDLRWRHGPVFVRYGAFTRQFVNHEGTDVAAIRDLDSGALVPDLRGTAFHVPPWVHVPHFLEAELDALGTTPPEGFPQVRGALHFSNAGGVYEAQLDGRSVILKEARPHIGWTPDGRDATTRLRDEAALLTSLQGQVPVPAALATFTAHDHMYLAMERIDAVSLSAAVASRNPLVSSDHTVHARYAYRDWTLAVTASLREALAALHDTGRVHGDLHPANVLVRDDNTVVLIDLEMSRPIDDGGSASIGAPGFAAKDERDALGHDLYALACTELFMFVPLIPLLSLDSGKIGELVNEATRQFDLGQDWADAHLAALQQRCASTEVTVDTPVTAHRIALTLASDATPQRDDRLWPGDPAQFKEPSTSVAHGALGVLTALKHAGAFPIPQQLAWLEAAETRRDSPTRLGLFDGLAGAIWAYRCLGLDAQADGHLHRLARAGHARLGVDLYGGLPGVGLTLLAESTRDAPLRDIAIEIATRVGAHWRAAEPRPTATNGKGGLMHGGSGTALFAMRLYESTGDANHLRIAREAIDFDLVSLKASPDGGLHVDEGWRLLPYLGNGSAGVGMVLTQLLTHLPGHSRYLETLDGIARAATAPFTVHSGLFQGRAGLIQFLLALEQAGLATAATSAAVHHHAAALQLHALRQGDEVRFVGDGLLRASCDLATGAAGVLATLIDYENYANRLAPKPSFLPYLTVFQRVEDHLPRRAARPCEGGEINGVPPVPAVA